MNANYGASQNVMLKLKWPLSAACFAVFPIACSKPAPTETAQQPPPAPPAPKIYVSDEVAGDISIIDSASFGGPNVDESTLPPPDHSADGTVSVIDTAAGKVLKTVQVGRRPRNVVFMPDVKHACINAENDGAIGYLDTVKNVPIKTIVPGKPGVMKPMGMALSADASKLYVSTGRGKMVFIIDTATNQPVTSFEVGQRPRGVALSTDGKILYSANGPSNNVSVVDLATSTFLKKVPVGDGPWGVIVLAP